MDLLTDETSRPWASKRCEILYHSGMKILYYVHVECTMPTSKRIIVYLTTEQHVRKRRAEWTLTTSSWELLEWGMRTSMTPLERVAYSIHPMGDAASTQEPLRKQSRKDAPRAGWVATHRLWTVTTTTLHIRSPMHKNSPSHDVRTDIHSQTEQSTAFFRADHGLMSISGGIYTQINHSSNEQGASYLQFYQNS